MAETTTGPIKGTLLLQGGGLPNLEFQNLFKTLAGGRDARLVTIPTALEDEKLGHLVSPITNGLLFGFPAAILHTRSGAVADSDAFVERIQDATGVFIEGGRQPRLAKAYLNTKTHQELKRLLARGGVIAGGSAGATIQGSFIVRNQGPPNYDREVMVDPRFTTEGFAFIKNVVIDQHVTQYGRQNHLAAVLKSQPDLLGIGIDEDTAIVVRGDVFGVIGSGSVYVWNSARGPLRPLLTKGDRYNMRARKRL
jgi:cyanophycinase